MPTSFCTKAELPVSVMTIMRQSDAAMRSRILFGTMPNFTSRDIYGTMFWLKHCTDVFDCIVGWKPTTNEGLGWHERMNKLLDVMSFVPHALQLSVL